jgi:hypothetical protein
MISSITNNEYNRFNVSFKSRNIDIRFADRIAREVNVRFPTLSLSKTSRYKNRSKVPKFHHGESKVWEKMQEFYDALGESFELNKSKKNYTKLNEYMKLIEKYKMANCVEQSLLALIIAKCSGLKNCSIRGLYGKENGWLDHAVVYVEDKKKPYIIDPWLGFADYLPKAFERYRGEYKNFFRRWWIKETGMYFEQNCKGSLFTDKILTPKSIEKFAKIRPELFLQQR